MYAKELTFNTGRGYSAGGQSITAVFVPSYIDDNGDQVGAIEFVDTTRGIDGRFDDVRFTNREIPDNVFKVIVLSRYDDGGYDSTQVIKLVPNRRAGYQVGRILPTCHFCGANAGGEYADDEGEVCNACEAKYGDDETYTGEGYENDGTIPNNPGATIGPVGVERIEAPNDERQAVTVVLISTETNETIQGDFKGPDGYALIAKAFRDLTGKSQYDDDQVYKVLAHNPVK